MTSTPHMPALDDKYDVGPYSFTVAHVQKRDPGKTPYYSSEAPLRVGRFKGYLTLSYEPWPDTDGELPFTCSAHLDLADLFATATPPGDMNGDGNLGLDGPDRASPEEAIEAVLQVLRELHRMFPVPATCSACEGRGVVQDDPDADEDYEMVECTDCGGTRVQHDIGPAEADPDTRAAEP